MAGDGGGMEGRGWGMATTALHTGRETTPERENSPPLFLTSSFRFESAEQARAIFAGEEEGNLYSRFTNPTVALFEERVAALEGAGHAVATASGMAAITMTFLAYLSAGDHVVISRSVFGSTTNIANSLLKRMGIAVTRVALSDLAAWEAAITPATRLFFLETPANPTLEMVDLAALCRIAHDRGIRVAVDNVLCTPCLQRPLELGADLVVHSATKYMDGQGRVLGGVIAGERKSLMDHVYPLLRNTGSSLSPFNAWVLFKGLETLPLRMERHCDNAERVAFHLAARPELSGRVLYPGLPDHPQRELAVRQMRRFGALVCLDLGSRQRAHRFLDGLRLAIITANLGDCRTLSTHPATTTHAKLTDAERQASGITEGLVRLSIGLEEIGDILADLDEALERSA
ncbi:O-succinylhomoserine sulfhydrylase [Candidatus Magnetaquicoccaceae bacterium FCR-1]|uniref:O-succinylhomoserine sulfhydrylase n=1 Tax=Candidatus Magnetaquiglobus chichijimensis TaxID=3141448 RepID=A0ABQ0C6G9_9PROT